MARPADFGAAGLGGADRAMPLVRGSPRLVAGLSLTSLLVLITLFANVLVPHPANAIDVANRLQGPSLVHLLGTDELGRDTFSRVLVGTRVSVVVSAAAIALGLATGVAAGSVSAYYGRGIDLVVTGVMDVLYAFPAILLAITVIAAFGIGLWVTAIAIGIVFIPYFSRLARATTQEVLHHAYIDVARTLGMTDLRILVREVLPNIASPMVSQAAVAMAYAIVTEAALSFLGLGAQPPEPSWGNMISAGRGFMATSPWLTVVPGAAIFIGALAFNLLGDGLRDLWDPRLRAVAGPAAAARKR